MWTLIALVMITVSLTLTWPLLGLPYGESVKAFVSKTFFGGKDIYAKDFQYAHELTWLQAPASITGFLEWMPAQGWVHFIEFAVFVGLYTYTKYNKLNTSKAA